MIKKIILKFWKIAHLAREGLSVNSVLGASGVAAAPVTVVLLKLVDVIHKWSSAQHWNPKTYRIKFFLSLWRSDLIFYLFIIYADLDKKLLSVIIIHVAYESPDRVCLISPLEKKLIWKCFSGGLGGILCMNEDVLHGGFKGHGEKIFTRVTWHVAARVRPGAKYFHAHGWSVTQIPKFYDDFTISGGRKRWAYKSLLQVPTNARFLQLFYRASTR